MEHNEQESPTLPFLLVSMGAKEKIAHESRNMLNTFGNKLYQYMVNPNKLDKEDLQRQWNAWEVTKEKHTYQDNLEIQNYMQKVHLPRQTRDTNYIDYKQQLVNQHQEIEGATVTEKKKQIRTYATMLLTKPTMDLPFPDVYTTEP
jgi:hypothetical protein